MKSSKIYTTIKVNKETNNLLLILKIKLGYKSVNDLLKYLINDYGNRTRTI